MKADLAAAFGCVLALAFWLFAVTGLWVVGRWGAQLMGFA